MAKRMLTAVLTAALALSLTPCGGGEQQEMGETRTVYTMDTVMNLTAYGENASAALDAAEETLRALDAKLDRHDETSTEARSTATARSRTRSLPNSRTLRRPSVH